MIEKIKRFWQDYIFTIAMALFIIGGSAVTVQAMQANPPAFLDEVVLGNVDGDVVEAAVESDDESLVTAESIHTDPSYFTIFDDDGDDDEPRFNGRGGRRDNERDGRDGRGGRGR